MVLLYFIMLLIALAVCAYYMRHGIVIACKKYIGGGDQYSWKKKTDIYDKYRPRYHVDSIQAALDYTKLDISKSVIVDMGSGTGILTRQLAEHKPKKLYAIDPDPAMLYVSKREKTQAVHIEGFSNKIDLPDNSADIITVGTALHWMEPESTIKEFKRILKKTGYIMKFSNSGRFKYDNNEIQDAENAAWEQVSEGQDSSQRRYRWRLEDVSDTYNIERRTGYLSLTKDKYVNTHLSESRVPTSGAHHDKYKKLLSDIYDKYKPHSRDTTRVVIAKI
jgi:SAM-dependent methyltransferase